MQPDRTWPVTWSFQETWNMMLYDRWPCRAKSISNPPHLVLTCLGHDINAMYPAPQCVLWDPAAHPHILTTHYSKPKKCYCKRQLSPRSKHLGLKNASQKHLHATVFSKNTPIQKCTVLQSLRKVRADMQN